ncbi:MAG: hypothetical protein AAF799_32480 [Myxococcota bacterium]
MLSLDSPMELGGIVVYRDHSNPRLFYYMPGAPRIAKLGDGIAFRLVVYRKAMEDRSDGDAPGGGFLDLTVDLGISKSKIEELESELSSRVGGTASVSPVQLEGGSVRLSTLGFQQGQEEASLFIESVIGSAKPALYGDNRATFSVELSHRGALIMRAAILEPGALPVSVVYDLQFKGMLPTYRGNIKIDFKQTYNHLRNRFQANTLVFKADMDQEFEKLQREEAIVIEQEDFVGLEPDKVAAERTRLEALAKELAAGNFFSPSINPGTVLAADRGTMSIYDATTDATSNTAGFTTPLVLTPPGSGDDSGNSGSESNVVEGTANVSGGLTGNNAGNGSGNNAGNGSGNNSGSNTPRQPTAVERWNQAGRPQAGFMLRRLQQQELRTVTYETKGSSAATRSFAPQGTLRALSGSVDPKSLVLEADLDHPFFRDISGKVRTNAKLDERGISSMIVEVKYGSADVRSSEAVLESDESEHAYSFAVDSDGSREISYRVTLNHVAGFALGEDESQTVSDWVPTTTRHLEVDPEAHSPMVFAKVEAGRVDWERTRLFEGAVVFGSERRAFKLESGSTSVDVPIRPGSRAANWQVEGTWHYTDGTRREVEALKRLGSDTVLLDANPEGITELRLELLDPLGRYTKAVVEVETGADDSASSKVFELTPGSPSGSWAVPNPASGDPVQFTYSINYFFRDGTVGKREGTTGDSQLNVGDVFTNGMLEVTVHVATDFEADGLRGVRVKLDYPNAPDGIDGSLDKVYMSTPTEPLNWRVPRGGPGQDEYEWTVQWIFRAGRPVTVGPTTTTDKTLLFFPELPS